MPNHSHATGSGEVPKPQIMVKGLSQTKLEKEQLRVRTDSLLTLKWLLEHGGLTSTHQLVCEMMPSQLRADPAHWHDKMTPVNKDLFVQLGAQLAKDLQEKLGNADLFLAITTYNSMVTAKGRC